MKYEEIANLASLVQIEVSEEEAADLIPKMESILGYIDQIKSVEVEDVINEKNDSNFALREDIPNTPNFTQDFLNTVPEKEDGYVKVIKVLSND